MLSDSVKTYQQTDEQIAAALTPDDSAPQGSHGRAAV